MSGIFGNVSGNFIDGNISNNLTVGKNATIGGNLSVTGTSALGSLITGTTFQGTNGNFTNLTGSYSGTQILAKRTESTNDNSTVVVTNNLGSLITNSVGIHLGYNAVNDVGSIYSMNASQNALNPLYLQSTFSYGNGSVYIPATNTDSLNEFTGSHGVQIASLLHKTNSITGNSGSGPVIESGGTGNFVNLTVSNNSKVKCTNTVVDFQNGKTDIDTAGNVIINDNTQGYYLGSNAALKNTALNFNGSACLTPSSLALANTTGASSGLMINQTDSTTMNWIAASIGAPSTNRIVMGNLGGQATIGSHSSTFSAWEDLYLNSGVGANTHLQSNSYSSNQALSVGGSVDTLTSYMVNGGTALTGSTLSLLNSANKTNLTSSGTTTRNIVLPDASGTLALVGGDISAIFSLISNSTLTTGYYMSYGYLTTLEYAAQIPMTRAGTIANLICYAFQGVGTGNATYTVRVNGTNTSVAAVIIVGTSSSTTNTVTVAKGDLVSVLITIVGTVVSYGACSFEFYA